MVNKLKAISKVSVALALLGAAVPAVEAAPTAMAAKKATKKAKKSTKKTVKKSTKKAKKAKKTTKKKATKKVAKKPAKKSVKKPVAKKPVKKAVKKPVAKKPAQKVVKKTTTNKPAKKVFKSVTMADKYQPKVKSGTVNLKWGTDVTTDSDYDARKFITNDSSIPVYTNYKYLDPVNGHKGGTYTTRIQVKYPDGSMEVVGTVTFVVPMMDADKYQPTTVQDATLNYDADYSIRKDFITNPAGYFPNDPALSQFEDDTDQTKFDLDSDPYLDTYKPGTYNAQIKVTYPDGSYEDTNKFKITVLPSDADKAKVSLKSSYFTVSSKETLEHETIYDDRTLNDPTRFLNIGSALPEGTVIHFNGDLDSVDTPEAGRQYRDSLTVEFPDRSYYRTDDFTVDVK